MTPTLYISTQKCVCWFQRGYSFYWFVYMNIINIYIYVVVAVYHTLQEIVTQCQHAQKKKFQLTKTFIIV